MTSLNLLGISGSLRAESYNSMLVQEAARLFDPAEFHFADLNLPLYDGDVEARGIPESVHALHAQMQAADAIVIATPEYNGNISGVLKNALDWASRLDTPPMADTPVAIMSAAAGRTGGATAQYSLRLCLVAFQPRILQGPNVAVAAAHQEFNADGTLKSESYVKALQGLMDKLRAAVA